MRGYNRASLSVRAQRWPESREVPFVPDTFLTPCLLRLQHGDTIRANLREYSRKLSELCKNN
jgi:hypothetical protein